jgi:hypothetical protein
VTGCRLDSSGSKYDQDVGSCEQGNEPFRKKGRFLSIREAVNLSSCRTALLPIVSYMKESLKASELIVGFCMYSAHSDDNGHPYIYALCSLLPLGDSPHSRKIPARVLRIKKLGETKELRIQPPPISGVVPILNQFPVRPKEPHSRLRT